MNIEKIRKDFPALGVEEGGKPIIYFDNACQSLRPQSVIDAMDEYYREYSACEGRSAHKFGEKVTAKVAEARKTVAKFIGAKKSEEIVFTRNTTEGINLVAHSLDLQKGDVIVVSDKEHNSNLIPWQIKAKREGLSLVVLPSKSDNVFDTERLIEIMEEERVKLISVVHTSNLDGVSNPIDKIAKIAHKYGAKIMVDGAQSASHQKINVSKWNIDFMAFSGHKMLGPSGTGFLYGKYELLEDLNPFMTGGDTVEYSTYSEHKLFSSPKKFEAGLQDYAGIIGLAEAVRYLKKIGFGNIVKREEKLNKLLAESVAEFSDLKIIGPTDYKSRGGILSFYVNGVDSHQIAIMLDSGNNIMVRSGQFCVHSWFANRQIKNAVRVSLAFYNTEEEIEIFVENLKKVIKLS